MSQWTAKIRLFRRRDVVASLAFACVFAVLGASVLTHLVHRIMVRAAQDRLMDVSLDSITKSDALADAALRQLEAMNASPLPRCSPQELDTLRAEIFRAGTLQDAGWFDGEQIRCSAEVADSDHRTGDLHEVARLADHLEIYRSDNLFSIERKPTLIARMGDAYVNTGELAQEFSGPSWLHFTSVMTDTRGASTAVAEPRMARIFSTEGRYLVNGSVYATACSTRYRVCDTVSAPVKYILDRAPAPTILAIACGIVMGGMAGGILPLLYQRRKTLESQLYRAIRKNQLHLEYQPIARIKDQRIVGAEVLCRWRNRDERLEKPQDFVRVAERKNWIGILTKQVVARALHECGELLRRCPGFTLSINLSPYCLRIPGFIAEMEELLKAHNVQPTSMALEITESAAAHDSELIEQIQALRALGHPIHLDDFGKGYSSLSYLHELRIDAIKIDQAFIQAVGTDSIEVDILPQILSIARNLRLEVVVEGIETAEQQAYIASISDTLLGQGWLYGRPAGRDELSALLDCGAECATS